MRTCLLALSLLFLFLKPVYAAQSTITEAEGTACMGDDKSRIQTEQAALIDAKKKAIEYVSTQIKSETHVKDFVFDKDHLSFYANAEVKIIQELNKAWYKDPSLGDCFRIKVKAAIIPNMKSNDKEYDERQHRCSERAAVKFSRLRAAPSVGIITEYDYESHYGDKLNQCFYLERMSIYNETRGRGHIYERKLATKMETLYEIYENKNYGNFIWDYVNNETSGHSERRTVSEMEWQALVKSKMEK